MIKIQIVIISLFLYTGCTGKSEKSTLEKTKSKTDVKVAIESIKKTEETTETLKNNDNVFFDLTFQKNRTLEDYKKNVSMFSRLEKQAQTIDVESVIPINESEFLYFYSLSYPEEYPESNLDLYYEIDELILDNANDDKGNCLFLYSNLAEFVDGEYAEYYFEAMEEIAQDNIDRFCNVIYDSLSDTSKERLEYIYSKYCKSAN